MRISRLLFGGSTCVPLSENQSLYPLITPAKGGETIDLGEYRGKLVLIVNTASKCGFTKQYDALENLYQKYHARGLEVLGFPSNDFMRQEPGDDAEIESFCRINHGVTFRLFPKGSVVQRSASNSAEIGPVFRALTSAGPKDLRGAVWWNFEKFLLDREGRLIARWRSWVRPESGPEKIIGEMLGEESKN